MNFINARGVKKCIGKVHIMSIWLRSSKALRHPISKWYSSCIFNSSKATMKKATPLVAVLTIIFTSCTCNQIKEKLLPSFNVNIPDINLTVPPLPHITDKEIPVGALKTHINMDSTIRANTAGTFGADAVHFVKVKKMVVKVSDADQDNNLSNFETARMRIYTDTTSTDIAVINFPATYSDSITVIPPASPDISNYLRGSNLAYNLLWKNRKPTRKFLKLNVKITIGVQ